MYYRFFLLSITVLFFTCCRENKQNLDAIQIVKEWTGKTIKLPDIEPLFVLNKDTVTTQSQQYRILLYVDSTGCTNCKTKLDIWKIYTEDLANVDFLFYFYPKNRKEFLSLIRSVRFKNCHIYIDDTDKLNKLNHFPNDFLFQCFLLDRNNKVLAIGNPTENPRIWELYKEIITGKPAERQPVTTVEAEQTEIVITDLQTGKTSEAVFRLTNTGGNSLAIIMVESSCGCTVPEWEKQPVAAGKTTEIKVKISPEKQEYFHKTVTVHCNTEGGSRKKFDVKNKFVT
jgi:hypothetical protein